MRRRGNLELRASGYRFRVTLHGRTHNIPLGTSDPDEAEVRAAKHLSELLRKSRGERRRGRPDTLTFSQLLVRFEDDRLPMFAWGTRKSYRHELEAQYDYFVGELGDPAVDTITSADLSAYLAWRRTRPRGAARGRRSVHPLTIKKARSIAVALFEFAKELRAIEANPARDVTLPRIDKRQPVILAPDQYEALLAACTDPMVRLFALTLGETGGRCESEVLWLRWEDVDLEGQRLEIKTGRDGHRTKTGKSRRVPLTPRLLAALRTHFATYRFSGSPWVFHHVRRRGHAKAGQRIRSLRRAIEGAAARAGIPAGFRQHDLRHRRVTLWLAEGAPAVAVQQAMGHSNIQTTMGYSHLADEHVDVLLQHENRTRPELRTRAPGA